MNYKVYGAAHHKKMDNEKKATIEENFNGTNIEDLLRGSMPEKVVRPIIRNVGPFPNPDLPTDEAAIKNSEFIANLFDGD